MNDMALGLDIGGTKIAAGLVTSTGQVTGLVSVNTPAQQGSAAVIDAMIGLARKVSSGVVVTAAGVGTAGVVDPRTQLISSATNLLPDWAGVDLAGPLRNLLGSPVSVLNDVHAHGLGEANFGAGRGLGSVLVVAAGTGIGGALVSGGRVMLGHTGAAGHIGHVPVPEAAGIQCTCGRSGHVEAIASGSAIGRSYQLAAELTDPVSAVQVIERAPTDPRAQAIVDRAGKALGTSIGGLVNTLNPAAVVVTGGLAGAPPFWWEAVRAGFIDTALPALADTPVQPGKLGNTAGVVGAAHAARQGAQS